MVPVRGVEVVERRIELFRIMFVEERGIETAQVVHRDPWMGVDENQAVSLGQVRQRVVALGQLVRPAKICRSALGHCLIEARGGPSAAVAPQQDLRDAWLLSEELDTRLDVEGIRL